jgi:acetyl-CoA carboxylase biotin carboxyl carrier protein
VSLTYKDVAEILRIVDESDVEELVLELADSKLVIRRNATTGAVTAEEPPAPPVPETKPAAKTAPVPPPEPIAVSESPPKAVAPAGTEIRAPMVGTFYRRPGPQDSPFVETGDHVAAGDPLCLIEVMKLFTTIESPVSGKVVQIAAENEALVELDDLLFVIEPD